MREKGPETMEQALEDFQKAWAEFKQAIREALGESALGRFIRSRILREKPVDLADVTWSPATGTFTPEFKNWFLEEMDKESRKAIDELEDFYINGPREEGDKIGAK